MPKAVILTSRPTGVAQEENFEIVERPSRPLGDGEIRVANRFLSIEPAMRGWLADTNGYAEPVPVGSVMRSLAVGEIVESRSGEYAVGEVVSGWFGWQEEAAVPASAVMRRITEADLAPSLALGILGMNGATAYVGMTEIGQPKPGETVVVSTAAGSVGATAGQIAKIMGARTVGITGGPVKVRQCLDEFGYDAAIDYRQPNLGEALDAACPDGIDVYYDNTSGPISDDVLQRINIGARIIICGTAAIQQWDPWPMGPRVERHLLVKRARMQGFLILDHLDRWDEAVGQLADWIREGKLRHSEDILDGIAACPDAIAGLYRGENLGKRTIRL